MRVQHHALPVWATIKVAVPGHYVVSLLHGPDGRVEPFKQLVLAWAFESGTLAPYPITLEGVKTDTPCILQPDGSIERANIDSFSSIEDWLADQRAGEKRNGGGDGE